MNSPRLRSGSWFFVWKWSLRPVLWAAGSTSNIHSLKLAHAGMHGAFTLIDKKGVRQRVLLIKDTWLRRNQRKRLTIPRREKGVTIYLKSNFSNIEAIRYI